LYRLTDLTQAATTFQFNYNGDGARLSLEVVGGNTTTYALDYLKSHRILMETTAQTTTLYLYGHSCLGEWTATDGWKYYLQSTLGQVRQAVDDVGNVIYSWAFNPDGTVLQGVQGPITHLECDAVYDWRTGLIYRLGRYFDPTTGVWLMGTGMLLAQAGTGGKRRSKRRLLLLMLLLLCVAGVLAACNNNPGPSLDPDPCKEITPFSTSLGKNAVFVGPTQGNSLSEYPPAITWSSNDKQKIETDLTDAIENVFGGTGSPNANPPIGVGFGSLPATLTNLGVSEQNPIIVVRRVNEPNDPGSGSPAAAFKPWVYVHNAYFSSDAGWQKRSLVHEIAHYWDDANGQGLSKDMSQWINWGDTPTDYQTGNPREVFAETTTVYFLSQYRDKTREWTDDFGAGFDLAKRNGATGPDQLMLDMNTKQPSATGTEEAKDRYDFLQWKFTGNWK
jgi:hypothetical protein